MISRFTYPILVLILSSILTIGCDQNRVFDSYYKPGREGWPVDSLVTFSFGVENTTRNHDLYLNIRNDKDYEFSNLWLFIKIIPPRGEVMTDTLQMVLADPSGRWLGKGFTGIYHSSIPYRTNVFFPVPGKYIVEIRHGMRPQVLRGLTHVGLRIEKTR